MPINSNVQIKYDSLVWLTLCKYEGKLIHPSSRWPVERKTNKENPANSTIGLVTELHLYSEVGQVKAQEREHHAISADTKYK